MKARDVEEICSVLRWPEMKQRFDIEEVRGIEHLKLFRKEMAVWAVLEYVRFIPRGDGKKGEQESSLFWLARAHTNVASVGGVCLSLRSR